MKLNIGNLFKKVKNIDFKHLDINKVKEVIISKTEKYTTKEYWDYIFKKIKELKKEDIIVWYWKVRNTIFFYLFLILSLVCVTFSIVL
jgi:hypothetical protein